MRTTTEDRGLIRRQAEPAPEPGHDVIIFDPMNGGRRFRAQLEPHEVYRPTLGERLLHRDRKPIAYAVSRDRHLHSFSRSMPTVHDIGLPVQLTLEVSVAEPRKVAENLDHDPLRRLEEEAATRVARAVKALDLAEIDRKALDVERTVLEHPADDDEGCRTTCGQVLLSFAPRLGLVLHRIGLQWSLPDDWVERNKTIFGLRHKADVKEHQEDHDHELRVLRERNAYLEATIRREREDFEHSAQLGRKYRSALTGKVIDTIGNQSGSSVPSMIRELGGLDRQLRALTQQSVASLPENGSSPPHVDVDGLAGVLAALLDLAADGRYDSPVRRRLLSAGLQAIAGAVGGDAEDEDDRDPERTLKQLLADLAERNALAANEHRLLLLQLADPHRLRELGWRGLSDGA